MQLRYYFGVIHLITMLLSRIAPLWLSATALFAGTAPSAATVMDKLPLHFEETGASFTARVPGFGVDLQPSAALFHLRSSQLRMTFAGSRQTAPVGAAPLPGVSNYFKGNQRSMWRAGVPHYSRVRYPQIYEGIDLEFYGAGRRLEYDFIVAPHADAAAIHFQLHDAQRLSLAAGGDLIAVAPSGELTLLAPVAYQMHNGKRQIVSSRFRVHQSTVSFELGDYDHSRTLVIDPVITFSTFLGGGDTDVATAMVLDSQSNIYVTGYTRSQNFPVPTGKTQPSPGNEDVFVLKLNPSASQIIYSTFIGGNDAERPVGIATDTAGNVVIAGNTNSADYPHNSGGFEPPGSAMFISRLSADGSSVLSSIFFGDAGPGSLSGLAIDAQANVYVAGFTSDQGFPTTDGALQPAKKLDYDGFVAKLPPSLSSVTYSTLLGGDGADRINAIILDATGSAYVTGQTNSSNFPVTTGAYVSTNRGASDAFVARINATGTALVFSAILSGTGDDYGQRLALAPGNNILVAGLTLSDSFPVTSGVFQPLRPQFATAAFLTKLNASGSALVYSTYFGAGSAYYDVRGIAQVASDSADNAYLAGYGFGNGMPTTPGALQSPSPGLQDGFLARFTSTADILNYSTFIGSAGDDALNAMVLDASANVYLAGSASSSNFPVLSAVQPTYGGATDAFVMKIDFSSGTSNCGYTISSTSFTTDSVGAEGSFTLTTGAGCTWTAAASQTWVRITSGTSGSGNALIVFQVDPNTTSANRTATITIGGRTLSITQTAAPCPYTVEPANRSLPASGGSLNVVVTTIAGCSWTAASNASWLRLTGGTSGNGTGLTPLTFDENTTGIPRTGSLTVARQGIQLQQPAAIPAQAYTDVPLTNSFADHIFLMKHYGIADLCGANTGVYCPDAITTRGMMAYFIIKATQQENFTFTSRPYFTDVPAEHPLFPYVQKLRDLGITVGCTATEFCPNLNVTRSQMATFIVRARLNIRSGQTFTFVSTPFFTDVPSTDIYFSFVQKMKELGITSGCSATEYCGSGETTRGQMAVFVIRGLKTP